MRHISSLAGYGRGKKALMVGNGPSVKGFDFSQFHQGEFYRIGMNRTTVPCQMVIYYDAELKEYFSNIYLEPGTVLVGFKNKAIDNTVPRCDYFYQWDDILYGDTGFHALQIADKILEFPEIFLIGYDYRDAGRSYHYFEDESDPESIRKFNGHSVKTVLPKYSTIAWKARIVNLDPGSALRVFPFNINTEEGAKDGRKV